jgi:signal transduction histidine kinase
MTSQIGTLLSAAQWRLEPIAKRFLVIGAVVPAVQEIVAARRIREAVSEATERARGDERMRLSRELHDGVGAALVGAILCISAASLTADEVGRNVLAAIEQDLIAVAHELRGLIDGLRPPVLQELGLVGAVLRHANLLEAGAGLRIDVIAGPGLDELPRAVEHTAHRIVGEALTNAARHAGARRCEVTLRRSDDALRLTVSDDGRGLTDAGRPGIGISAMRQRAAELGGRCEWHPRPAGGTLVDCRLPLSSR